MLVGCGGAAPTAAPVEGPADVTFAINPGVVAIMGVYIGYYLNYFKKNNLNVTLLNAPSGTTVAQLLNSGQATFGILDIPTIANSNAAGADLKLVAGLSDRFPGALVCLPGVPVTRGYPQGMKSLEGHTVGISGPGSSTETFVKYSMIQAGADPTKTSFVTLGGVPQYIAAIQAKRVDCADAYQPIQTELGNTVVTIVDFNHGEGPKEFLDYTYNDVAVSNAYAKLNPTVIKRMQTALRQAIPFGKDPKNAQAVATAVAPQFSGIDNATMLKLVQAEQSAFVSAPDVTQSKFDNASKIYSAVFGKQLNTTLDQLLLK